jgi:hypothetical protein
MNAERRRIAVHEAGHAVASIVLGVPIEYVSIRTGLSFRGVALRVGARLEAADDFDPFRAVAAQPPELRADVERRIIGDLAGPIAEMFLADEPAARSYGGDEAETIARDALATLGPRLAELVAHWEMREERRDGDEADAAGLAYAFAGPEAGGHYLEWLRAEARALVLRYRFAVLSVADALERAAVLSGEQVAALVYPPEES